MILAAMEVVARNAVADIRINDVPVVIVGEQGNGSAFVPATPFIVSGANRLAARVMLQPVPPGEAPEVMIRIAVFQEGDEYFTNAGQQLARLEWRGDPSPAMLDTGFEAGFGPPAWSWMACEAWTSVDQAMADASPFLGNLARAFYASDADWFDGVSDPKLADMTQAFDHLDEPTMRARLRADTAALPPAPPQPIRPVPQLCGNGRLLAINAPGAPPMVSKPDSEGQPAAPRYIIGKLGGAWRIIR